MRSAASLSMESSLKDSIAFFEVLGVGELRRRPDKTAAIPTLLAAPADEGAAVDLTCNWDPAPISAAAMSGIC